MTPETPYMTPEAREGIGAERVYVSDVVSRRHILEYIVGVGDDEAYAAAQTASDEDLAAPPMFHAAATRPVVPESSLAEDGQYVGFAVEGIVGRTLAGSQETELFAPVRVGDVITERERVAGIEEKHGRSGKLILVTLASEYTNQRGEIIARGTSVLIFR